MGLLYTADQLPTTSEQAIREFDERYLAAISAAEPPSWARDLGDVFDVGAPRVTFPMTMLAGKYRQTNNPQGRFKRMREESFDMRVSEFDEGFEAPVLDLKTNVFAYRQWSNVPNMLRVAEARHINRNIVTLLEAGTTGTTPWDGLAFFSASHKANPLDAGSTTFSNYQNSTKDVADVTNIEAEVTIMRGVLDENGEKLGVEPDTLGVPTAKYQKTINLLKQDLIANAAGTATIRNPFLGTFNVVHMPELSDGDDWYLFDSKLMSRLGAPPWVGAKYLAPNDLGLRFWDESSDFFKDTGMIKVSSHIWYGFALLFPHACRLVKGA